MTSLVPSCRNYYSCPFERVSDARRILLTLTRELNEAGWIDEVKSQSKGPCSLSSLLEYRAFKRLYVHLELAKQPNPQIPFQKLFDETMPVANGRQKITP